MPDYAKLYHIMFNAATDAIELLPDCEAKLLLIKAQLNCEELYIESANTEREDISACFGKR